MITFEFDKAKSQANLHQHGIHFIAAQALWDDCRLLKIPVHTEDDPRYLVIGLINDQHWSALMQDSGSNIELIAVRRSLTEEVALYESQIF